jgi:SAM-dependent methyltransferase
MTPSPSANDVKSWYNQHYAAKGLESMRPAAAYPVFLDLLDAKPGTRLLDVSCGAGSLLAAAHRRGVAAVGVDLSDEAVRLAKRVTPGAEVAVGAGEALAFHDHTFDYVSCLGALEHFLDMGQGLEEMKRVAKPDARLCIMVPNQDFIGWKVLGHQGTAQQDINEHLLPLAAWRRLFEQHGLSVLRVVPDRWHAVRWRSRNGGGGKRGPARFVIGPALEVAWRLVPLRWQYQFVFVLANRSTPPTSP